MTITAIGSDGKAYMNGEFIGIVVGMTPPLVLSAGSTVFVQMMTKVQASFERFGNALRYMPGRPWPRHRRFRNLRRLPRFPKWAVAMMDVFEEMDRNSTEPCAEWLADKSWNSD